MVGAGVATGAGEVDNEGSERSDEGCDVAGSG